jgi:hypothetical protein
VGATDEDYLLAKPIFLMFLGRVSIPVGGPEQSKVQPN